MTKSTCFVRFRRFSPRNLHSRSSKSKIFVSVWKVRLKFGIIKITRMVSRDIQWAIIRNTSSFLLKRRGINKTFTREPNNLKGVNSFRYNGLIHKRVIGVEALPDGKKGVVLVTKRQQFQRKPAKSMVRTTLTRGRRPTMTAIKNVLKSGHYKVGLVKAAQRRAAQIIRSQRPLAAKKQRRRTRKEKSAK